MKNKFLARSSVCFLLLSSCNETKLTANVFVYDESDTFIHARSNSLREGLSEAGYAYQVSYASNSQIKQNEAIVSAIDEGNPARMFINPVDRMSASAIIDKVSRKDIPVVFFNRQPLDFDRIRGRKKNDKIFYVGTDPVFEGKEQAEMAEALFQGDRGLNPVYDKNGDGKIQLILIKGEIGHQDTEKRSDSALSAFSADGFKTETLNSVYCNWSRSKAKASRKNIREQFGNKIEVVLSNNDDRALGVIDYLKDNGYIDKNTGKLPFPVFGIDGTEVGLKSIREGYLSGTVKNEGKSQADACIEIVKDLLSYGKLASDFPYPRTNEYTISVEGRRITLDTMKAN